MRANARFARCRSKERVMFGKPVSAYLRFQKAWLILLAAVGLARLGLSLAGVPDRAVMWLSMTAVGWAAIISYGVAVHTSGFGTFRHLVAMIPVLPVLVQ